MPVHQAPTSNQRFLKWGRGGTPPEVTVGGAELIVMNTDFFISFYLFKWNSNFLNNYCFHKIHFCSNLSCKCDDIGWLNNRPTFKRQDAALKVQGPRNQINIDLENKTLSVKLGDDGHFH